jgi:hypothetical protein
MPALNSSQTTTQTTEPPNTQQPSTALQLSEVELHRLAQKVYELLRQELWTERERIGRLRL